MGVAERIAEQVGEWKPDVTEQREFFRCQSEKTMIKSSKAANRAYRFEKGLLGPLYMFDSSEYGAMGSDDTPFCNHAKTAWPLQLGRLDEEEGNS